MFRESILLLASLSLSLAPAVSAQDYEYDPTSKALWSDPEWIRIMGG